ncbi:hypothetical protein DV711_16965 [Motiliproteus coralliicola]|uniref:Sel1 repeat family protein n=1 Tax=Motiliproteus coralliicola TaxID=2283196 RepID=A0A369W8N1_9GAMM|nr:hypothetical protein [Motiliproteus coralliicola]RDE18348.1 hypothetical protein DV711_16965 [Motiliproteus coralliicola]
MSRSVKRRLAALWLSLVLVGTGVGLGSASAQAAEDRLQALVVQLQQGQVSDWAVHLKGMHSADGLFLLGWLLEGGVYGVEQDLDYGQQLIQQAAEMGHLGAIDYCWQRCLVLTPAIRQHLQQAAVRDQAHGLYLQSQLGATPELPSPDRMLLEAARQGHPDALGTLYVDHFVNWSRQKRSLDQAETKLKRCVDEGISICYYLLGALFERHGDHQQALLYFQLLQLVDRTLFDAYVSEAHMEQLMLRIPQPARGLIRNRAATQLALRAATGNDRIDRFRQCADQAGYDCVARVSRGDDRCMLSYFESSHLRELRDSPGYRRCLEQLALR